MMYSGSVTVTDMMMVIIFKSYSLHHLLNMIKNGTGFANMSFSSVPLFHFSWLLVSSRL